jgi:hypothetical protein
MRVTREIAWLLAIKLIALTVLYYAFFSPSHQPHPDAHAVAAHVMGGG